MLEKIIWSDAYLLNIDEIDSQHKHISSLINNTIELLQQMSPAHELERSLKDVLDYARIHFDFEESLMKIYKYPALIDHQDEHKTLLEKLTNKIDELHQKDEVNVNFYLFIVGWFGGHSFGYDRRLSEFILKKRNK